jgi:hypothetical protein
MRIATVKVGERTALARQSKRAYSAPHIPRPEVKLPPNMTQEELGTRQIEGVAARGVKTTTLGTEKDGDWNGKPIRESELWVSDDLAAQMLRIDKDLRTGSAGRSELLSIRREEPDPELFEIPKDYEVNPSRMPSTKDLGVVRPSGR